MKGYGWVSSIVPERGISKGMGSRSKGSRSPKKFSFFVIFIHSNERRTEVLAGNSKSLPPSGEIKQR